MVTIGTCTTTYTVADADYPSRTVYLTREIFEPAKPAYYSVIPSAHCPKGTTTRYVTAPLQAGIDGSPITIPEINTAPTEVEKSRDIGATVSGFANIVVKDNLTFEEYQRAIDLLRQIEAGTHHVESSGVLQTSGAFTTTNITYHNEVTSVHQPGGVGHPLLVDIEAGLRLSPVDRNGVTHPPPTAAQSKEGFLPLGGAAGVAPTAALPDNDPQRFGDAFDLATRQESIASQTDPNAPRDMINKYKTVIPSGYNTTEVNRTNGDRAVVSNDVVLFLDPSVGGTGPARPATGLRDSPTLPRTFTSPTLSFR